MVCLLGEEKWHGRVIRKGFMEEMGLELSPKDCIENISKEKTRHKSKRLQKRLGGESLG